MKASEIKKLIIGSADEKTDTRDHSRLLEDQGVSFDFREGFTDSVIERISGVRLLSRRNPEFSRNLNYAFYRIALTGAAAIIILMISIFIMQGSFSLNSLLGIGDGYDESIVYLITGI